MCYLQVKKNYHLDELMQMIDQYIEKVEMFMFVGVTNVGKSSLINSLLKA